MKPQKKVIKFKPSQDVYHPTFATCELPQGDFKMLQLPGGAINTKANLSIEAEKEYELRVFEYGNLSGESCENLGDEFNPFAVEAQQPQWNGWGWSSPSHSHADERQGKIDSFETDGEGNVEFRQQYFLQNLGGDDSLIGRSMALFEKDDDTPISCCIIAVDIYREPEVEAIDD